MYKFFLVLFCILFLNGCATSGTALLGPLFTGAKTGSIYQTSLSYSSSRVINNIASKNSAITFNNKETFKKKNPTLPDIPYIDKNPKILSTYKVNFVQISNLLKPEHHHNLIN